MESYLAERLVQKKIEILHLVTSFSKLNITKVFRTDKTFCQE